MKKKTTFLKTLLVAAGLLAGVNGAWADTGNVTTNADIDFSSAITGTNPYTIEGTVGKMTWTQQWSYTPTIVDGILRFGNFNGGVVELQNNNIRSKDVVTIKFDMAFGKLSGKHVGFDLKDTDGSVILTQWFDAYNGDFDDANPLNLSWDKMYRGSNEVNQERCVNFTITLNYEAGTITTNTSCYLSGASKPITNGEFEASLPSSKPLGSFVLQGNINNTGRYSTFDNLKITTTEGDYTVATANYTVKWQLNGVDIKTPEVRTGDVNAAINLVSSDKANFFNGDETERYIYESDDAADKTVAEDGSTIVTINFRSAEKWSYNVTSSYTVDETKNTLGWAATGNVWEDLNTVAVYYPRFQAYGTTLVGRDPVGNELKTTVTVANDNYEQDLAYTSTGITDLYLLSEAEDLGSGLSTSGTSFTNRVSNRQIIYGAKGTLVTLPAGKYIFTLGAIGGSSTSHKVNYVVSAGSTTVASGTCTGNFLSLFTGDEFELKGTTPITFTCSDPSSDRGIDLIYIQKTGDADLPDNESVPITDAGYATYCSEYDLDLSGVTAYTATVADKTVTFTQNTGKVVAGTGLLIKAAAGTVNIPVVSDGGASAVANNALIGVLADTEVAAGSFVLMKASEGVGFYKTNNAFTVGANTAYIAALPDAAKSFIGFDEVTGIESMKAEKNVANGQWFNLAGQRVAQPTKGLYIQNGKKVIVK